MKQAICLAAITTFALSATCVLSNEDEQPWRVSSNITIPADQTDTFVEILSEEIESSWIDAFQANWGEDVDLVDAFEDTITQEGVPNFITRLDQDIDWGDEIPDFTGAWENGDFDMDNLWGVDDDCPFFHFAEANGCPDVIDDPLEDWDDDGVRNGEDMCPYEPGPGWIPSIFNPNAECPLDGYDYTRIACFTIGAVGFGVSKYAGVTPVGWIAFGVGVGGLSWLVLILVPTLNATLANTLDTLEWTIIVLAMMLYSTTEMLSRKSERQMLFKRISQQP